MAFAVKRLLECVQYEQSPTALNEPWLCRGNLASNVGQTRMVGFHCWGGFWGDHPRFSARNRQWWGGLGLTTVSKSCVDSSESSSWQERTKKISTFRMKQLSRGVIFFHSLGWSWHSPLRGTRVNQFQLGILSSWPAWKNDGWSTFRITATKWISGTKRYQQSCVGVSKNRGTPKWMVYNGNPY